MYNMFADSTDIEFLIISRCERCVSYFSQVIDVACYICTLHVFCVSGSKSIGKKEATPVRFPFKGNKSVWQWK